MSLRIDRIVTSGTFELEGGVWDVDNNVWLVGNDDEVLVIDAPHDADAIAAAVGGRRVVAIALSHGHSDHVNAAPRLAELTGAPVLLHPDDLPLWRLTHADPIPDGDLREGQRLTVAGAGLTVVHTPGHTPGSVSFHVAEDATLFSGDTLFQGGPGATGRAFSSFPLIIESIRGRLLTLPSETAVLPGHGDTTTIGAEAPHLDEWIARGH